jgi:2-polyprenyl-3-methyl-5-hydroxy-6-metoxy-1,4-benzoquinol methylase
MKPVPCALCGSWKSHVIDYVPQHSVNLGGAEFVRDITNVICEDCGLLYNNPRLEPGELEELYSAMTRPTQPPASPVGELEKEQFGFVRSHLGQGDLTGLKVMEVGCSLGRFLQLFYKAGAEVYGVEPSESDADYAQKVNHVQVRRGFFKANSFPAKIFDLVVMLYVLEHVADPLATLEGIHQQLKPQGLLFLEVPDSSRPFVGLDPFFSIGHLFSYTPATLKSFLNKASFELIQLDQISGAKNTGKDFPRLRALARKVDRVISVDYGDEFMIMSKTMSAYRENLAKLVERINNLLTPLLERWIRSGERVVIFGAGTHSSELLKHTDLRKADLVGFVDSNPLFQGHSYLGLPVYSPASMEQLKPDAIVISARGWETEIWEILAPQRARGVEVITLYRTELMEGKE